ncbi:hypothetical protein HY989_02395 [Candidatus Micrarchaeota archaeon]|nr:hypothetical protein [Candidatus Micrarchaeota archaeon]
MKLQILLFVLAAFGTLAISDFAYTRIFFNVTPSTNVSITGLTISSNPLYTSSSTTVYVALYNAGTLATSVSVNVSIYNESGYFVQNITYVPATVPHLSSLTISATWNLGAVAAGNYTANATAVYETGTNSTNEYSINFTITQALATQPSPTASPSGGGGSVVGGNVDLGEEPGPTMIPPEISPASSQIKFVKTTILREISAGSSGLESFVLRNLAGGVKNLDIGITGAPKSWISFSSEKTILLAGEERAINIGFSIPQDALPGDYLLKISANGDGQTAIDYMLLRVSRPSKGAQYPQAQKIVRLDRGLGTTSVTLELTNPTTKTVPLVSVVEEILPQFHAQKSDISFVDKIGMFVSEKPLQIRWQFKELASLEKTSVSYLIYSMLDEYSPYLYWNIKQVAIAPKELKLSDVVGIREISSSEIFEGGSGQVLVKVFYSGFEPVTFNAALEAPSNFAVEPSTQTGTLTPRGTTELLFKIKAPSGSAGTHNIGASLLLNDEIVVSQTGYLVVQKQFALSWDYMFGGLLVVAILIFAMSKLLKRGRKRSERRHHAELRQGYIEEIKDHIKDIK